MCKLAIDGGRAVRNTSFKTGKKFDETELKQLKEALENNTLFCINGKKTGELCRKAEEYFGMKYCTTASSGTAAIHAAVASLEIEPGNEVITSPLTDLGTAIGILYQNLIPVFADVDPYTYLITADSIKKKITAKTKAIVAVHLGGNPCEMDEIISLAKKHNLPLIEDCAQAHNTQYKGKKVGTIGDIGCFSLNGSKHINSGEGGFIITNNQHFYRKSQVYVDKYYNRNGYFITMDRLAPNYRITELQSAVALAQLDKLDKITKTKNNNGDLLTELIKDLPGIYPYKVYPYNKCSYFMYLWKIDPDKFKVGRDQVVKAIKAEGVDAENGYREKPLYLQNLFIKKNFFPGNIWPAEVIAGKPYSYEEGVCPVAEEVCKTTVRMRITEFLTEKNIRDIARVIKKVVIAYLK